METTLSEQLRRSAWYARETTHLPTCRRAALMDKAAEELDRLKEMERQCQLLTQNLERSEARLAKCKEYYLKLKRQLATAQS